jgi:hypothetical protein
VLPLKCIDYIRMAIEFVYSDNQVCDSQKAVYWAMASVVMLASLFALVYPIANWDQPNNWLRLHAPSWFEEVYSVFFACMMLLITPIWPVALFSSIFYAIRSILRKEGHLLKALISILIPIIICSGLLFLGRYLERFEPHHNHHCPTASIPAAGCIEAAETSPVEGRAEARE